MKCPKCSEKSVIDRGAFLACEDHRKDSGCNFILWRNQFSKLGHETLADDQLKKLIAGEVIELKFISPKTAKPFTCGGIMKEVDGKWKIEFVFETKTTSSPVVPAKIFGEDKPVLTDGESSNDNWKSDDLED